MNSILDSKLLQHLRSNNTSCITFCRVIIVMSQQKKFQTGSMVSMVQSDMHWLTLQATAATAVAYRNQSGMSYILHSHACGHGSTHTRTLIWTIVHSCHTLASYPGPSQKKGEGAGIHCLRMRKNTPGFMGVRITPYLTVDYIRGLFVIVCFIAWVWFYGYGVFSTAVAYALSKVGK